MNRLIATPLLSICLVGSLFLVTLKTLCGTLLERESERPTEEISESVAEYDPLDEAWEQQSKENLERWILWYENKISQPTGNEAIPSNIVASEENCEREADRNYEEHMKHLIPWPIIY